MTKREAAAVARAIAEADGRCSYCAGDVARMLNASTLGWRWVLVSDEEDGWRVAVIKGDGPLSEGLEELEP